MKTLPILSLAFALLLGVTSTRAETRTWTSAIGTKVEAELVTQNSTHVDLKLEDGKILHLAKDQLSANDKTFLVEAGRKIVKTPEAEKVNYVTLATGLRVVQVKKPAKLETEPERTWTITTRRETSTIKGMLIARGENGAAVFFPYEEKSYPGIIEKEALSKEDLKYLEKFEIDEEKFKRYTNRRIFDFKGVTINKSIYAFYESEDENEIQFRMADESVISVPRERLDWFKGMGFPVIWPAVTFTDFPEGEIPRDFRVKNPYPTTFPITAELSPEKTIKVDNSRMIMPKKGEYNMWYIDLAPPPNMEPGYYRAELELKGEYIYPNSCRAYITFRHGKNQKTGENEATYVEFEISDSNKTKPFFPTQEFIKIDKEVKGCMISVHGAFAFKPKDGKFMEIAAIRLYRVKL
jgi:hypothetical protein